ncbi:hypothetical protein UB31_28975 [Bradyrhizobium sp. LTSP849]|uniref:hypothetical protein n=1 Tax=unclassified Bradyrhizobium TaxID=2631580 RepID=UPI0005D15FBD|nr:MULTISPECIES: hypothetical protein [unclassified Bradyrhizobium]KJC35159.1 hypothetical protein UP06_37800 [Bradyrhizobium sp. LTSP857]KJC39474.1 hypothetical protein UB31_28975 [Bradyrhizobium sp. LTSP849]
MLPHISTVVLTLPLIFTVADTVPTFNIQRGCKVDSAAAFDPNAGMSATIKRCVDDEQRAKDQLQTQWSVFLASDRTMCMSVAVGEKADDNAMPPSYVELLTCLQDQQFARKLPKN